MEQTRKGACGRSRRGSPRGPWAAVGLGLLVLGLAGCAIPLRQRIQAWNEAVDVYNAETQASFAEDRAIQEEWGILQRHPAYPSVERKFTETLARIAVEGEEYREPLMRSLVVTRMNDEERRLLAVLAALGQREIAWQETSARRIREGEALVLEMEEIEDYQRRVAAFFGWVRDRQRQQEHSALRQALEGIRQQQEQQRWEDDRRRQWEQFQDWQRQNPIRIPSLSR